MFSRVSFPALSSSFLSIVRDTQPLPGINGLSKEPMVVVFIPWSGG